MKKLLALVLALVMTMGLATVGTNAAFDDEESIDHTEAVEVMNALNIINGFEDGSFKPEGNVTRAQMAKMVTIALLGDVGVSAFTGTVTDLTDIDGHWAEGYIKYCYSQGIISGRGNGIFDPDNNVTTAEASKMLLVALGYDATVRKYTGDDWTINVARDAQQRGLYEEISDLTSGKDMTRDDAAQMIYNTLRATRIVETQTKAADGSVSTSYEDATGAEKTLLTKTFKANEYIGILNVPTYSSTSKKYSYTSADWDNKNDTTLVANVGATHIFTSEKDYTELQGEEVDVTFVVKNGDITVLNIAATGKTPTIVSEQSKIESVTSDNTKIKIDGTEYTISNAATVAGVTGTSVVNVQQGTLVDATSHDMVKLIDTSKNGTYDAAIITDVTAAKVTYVSSSEIIAGGTSYKIADNNVESGLAKDDYVAIYREIPTAPYTVVKAEKVEGKIDGYKTNKVYVGGTWYNFAGTEFAAGSAGKDASFWQYNGVVIADSSELTETSSLDDVVLVYNVDGAAVIRNAQYIDKNGTKNTVKVDTTSSNAPAVPTAGSLYTVKSNDNGYQFTAVTADIGDYSYKTTGTTGGTTNIETIGGTTVADDAVVFIYDSATPNAKVVTGKQAAANVAKATYATSSQYFTGKSNGLTRVVMALVSAAGAVPSITDAADYYAIIVEDAFKIDDDYISYKIWDGSSVVTVREKKVAELNNRTQLEVIGYSKLDGDVIKDVKDTTHDSATTESYIVGGAGTDTIYIGGEASGNKKSLKSDTVYMYYHADETDADKIGVAGGELVNADKVGDTYINNVFYVDDSGDIKFILAEVKNNTGKTYATTSTVTANGSNTVTGALKTGTSAALAAGETITYTLTENGTAATDIRVTLTDSAGGTQVVKTTIAQGATIDVDFRMPAGTIASVKVDEKVTYSAVTGVASGSAVNGIYGSGVVESGTWYEGDTVKITVTLAGGPASAATDLTLTGTTTGKTAVSTTSASGVTADTTNNEFDIANSTTAANLAGDCVFTITATYNETAPAVSLKNHD